MKESQNESEELELIDIKQKFKDIKKTIKKNPVLINTSVIILMLIVIGFFSIYFRAYTLTLPQTENWAQNAIIANFKSQIKAQINQEYPNLPEQNKDLLVSEKLKQVMKSQESSIDSTKKQLAQQFKQSFQNDNNHTYLLAIDPYTYFRALNNLVNKGTVCDAIINNKCWNTHTLAPYGSPTRLVGHVIVMYTTYKVLKFFNPNITLLASIYLLPAIIIMLASIAIFFLLKKRFGLLAGIFGSLVVALHPYLLGRTPAGFVDTDAYGILWPIVIILTMFYAFESRQKLKAFLVSVLAGAEFFLFFSTWGGGWFFTFDILLVALVITIVTGVARFVKKHPLKHHSIKKYFKSKILQRYLLILIGFAVGSIIVLGKLIYNAIVSAIGSTHFQNAVITGLWPNVYTTVAELNAQALSGILSAMSSNKFGLFIIGIAILSIPLFLTKKYNYKTGAYLITSLILVLIITNKTVVSKISPMLFLSIIFLIYIAGIIMNIAIPQRTLSEIFLISMASFLFMGSIYASTKGIRFVLLGIVPLAILLALFFGILFKELTKYLYKSFDVPKIVTQLIVIFIALIIILNYVSSAKLSALNEIPQMNDAWYKSLTKIKQNSEPNAIINSWWDFGHWFKAVADRAVTFDGGSQNTPMAHWIGKVLATNNETLAINILQMLDCGSSRSFDIINKKYDFVDSINILNKIISITNKQDAKIYISTLKLNTTDKEKLLNMTKCEPPEDYFITSDDMVSKSGVWAHFGLWNFTKAYLYKLGKTVKNLDEFKQKVSRFNFTEQEILELYNKVTTFQTERDANTWISGWPGYLGTGTCVSENDSIHCKPNIAIGNQGSAQLVLTDFILNKKTLNYTSIISAVQSGRIMGQNNVTLARVVIGTKDDIISIDTKEKPELNLGITIINNKFVVSSPELTDSIFTRLYYFDGAYTKHFIKFSDERDRTTNNHIIIWKIDWKGTQPYVSPKFI